MGLEKIKKPPFQKRWRYKRYSSANSTISTTERSSKGPLKWTVAVLPSSFNWSIQTEVPLYFTSMSAEDDNICLTRFAFN
jgi:hypothetical protein